jgi:hypothetical protein
MVQDVYGKMSGIIMAKAVLKNKSLFASKLGINLRKQLVKGYFGAYICVVLKYGQLGQLVTNTWNVLEVCCSRRMGKIS